MKRLWFDSKRSRNDLVKILTSILMIGSDTEVFIDDLIVNLEIVYSV